MLMDIAGSVADVFTYDAYGTLIASNTTSQTAYLYCGQQFDSDLGFYYLRARYYKRIPGSFGRWTHIKASRKSLCPYTNTCIAELIH